MLLNTYQLAILNIYWNVLNNYKIYNDVILKHSEIHIFTEISDTIISELIQETLKSYFENLLFERNIWNYYCRNDFSNTYCIKITQLIYILFFTYHNSTQDLFILFMYFLRNIIFLRSISFVYIYIFSTTGILYYLTSWYFYFTLSKLLRKLSLSHVYISNPYYFNYNHISI